MSDDKELGALVSIKCEELTQAIRAAADAGLKVWVRTIQSERIGSEPVTIVTVSISREVKT